MKRLLIGGLAVGSLLFAASGVAAANTALEASEILRKLKSEQKINHKKI